MRFGRAGAETGQMALMGGVRNVQFEHIDLCLKDDSSEVWTARVAFITARDFQMPFQGILGTEGFLDRWAVAFNKYYEYFEIESPQDAYDRSNA